MKTKKDCLDATPSHTGCADCCDTGNNKKALSTRIILLTLSLISLILSFIFQEAELFHRLELEVFYLFDIALVAVIVCGLPVIISALHALKHKKMSSSLLITIAIIACITLQVVSFFGIEAGDGGHGHDESFIFIAGEIAFILAIGEFLEEMAFVKSGKQLQGFKLIKEGSNGNIFDKWAEFIIPLTLTLSVFTAFFSYFIIETGLESAVVRAITVLVVFCPCSLALSSPTAIGAGAYALAKRGINISSYADFEMLSVSTSESLPEKYKLIPSNSSEIEKQKSELSTDNSSLDASILNKAPKNEAPKDLKDIESVNHSNAQNKAEGAELIWFAKRVLLIVRLNLILSLTINSASALLSIFGFIPPFVAALVHNFSILAIILNSALLFIYVKKIPLTA